MRLCANSSPNDDLLHVPKVIPFLQLFTDIGSFILISSYLLDRNTESMVRKFVHQIRRQLNQFCETFTKSPT